jgi:bifunctional non-homologous end joining protein LigD
VAPLVFFYAFDILELDGGDLRSLPLLKRKRHLKRLIPAPRSALLYVDHVIGKAIVTAIEERKRVIGEAAAARRDVDKQLAELGLLSR